METPNVFISATKEDLESYRQAARDAAIKAGFYPDMMEDFPAGGKPSLKTCLEKVKPCDVLVVIVAHRYGWIPRERSNKAQKSITWLECEQAVADGKEVLAFLVDENYSWPEEKKETYRLTKSISDGSDTPELYAEVRNAVKKLNEFKSWLKQKFTVTQFTSEQSLQTAVLHALNAWKEQHARTGAVPARPIEARLEVSPAYREWLGHRCATVELLAQMVKQGCAPPRLSSVYVPAPTMAWRERNEQSEEKLNLLLDRFGKQSLYVPGLAGSGKSTFARWVAFLLCQGSMPEQIQKSPQKPIVEQFPSDLKDKLPLLIPFRELWYFLPAHTGQRELSAKEFAAALKQWAIQKLEEIEWPTIARFIEAGKAVLLFDGVDEIPISAGESRKTYYPREMMIHGLKDAVPNWLKAGNRILLTSRPYGLTDADALAMGLPRSEIIDLPDPLQELFINRWFVALDYGFEMASLMMNHLAEREELSPLRGNPVLLMAMCILFPEGKRLPQDKAELYQKTIERILFNRYGDSNEVEQVGRRLSVIAYGMHTGEGLGHRRSTPQATITYDEIDRVLTHYLDLQKSYTESGFTTVAQAREELLSRSGLLIQKEQRSAAFYHFSFQEYLAGRRLVQLAGDRLAAAILKYANIPEWRPTLAFAFGTALPIFGSEKIIPILTQMISNASLSRLGHLVLTADLIEIVYRKNYRLQDDIVAQFRTLCLEAIEKEVPLAERYDLGRSLGLVGDPRIVQDLRQSREGYILIPAGNYLFGGEKIKRPIEKPFFISRYPVTNGQYQLFIEDGGYQDDRWWSAESKEWRHDNDIHEPLYWRHGKWNGANLPAVGISWYEADAFCRWAGGRLPHEWEWEAAACGPHGYQYPWGNEWKDGIFNSREAGLGKTSPVGLFPRSRSRDFGLEDMAGNVREWCADWYDEKSKSSRVVRGGSCYDTESNLSCSYRGWNDPGFRSGYVGFRVCCGA